MAITFTSQQTRVLQARNHNILVSAAAGSGKTAVLVERIVRMISEGDSPLDIDRLLVVTFTKAAAAQMRERIGAAIAKRIEEDPGNAHLQRQETLLHNAQITTMDSFFTFLLRNNFSDIDMDPAFRQMDQTEGDLMRKDALEDFLEPVIRNWRLFLSRSIGRRSAIRIPKNGSKRERPIMMSCAKRNCSLSTGCSLSSLPQQSGSGISQDNTNRFCRSVPVQTAPRSIFLS